MAKISKIDPKILQNYEDDEFPKIQKYDGLTKVFDPDGPARVDEIVDARQQNKIQYQLNDILFVISVNRVFCGNTSTGRRVGCVQGLFSARCDSPESRGPQKYV